MRKEITTEPASEPISLIEAKNHCIVDHSEDDYLLNIYIKAARLTAQGYANKLLGVHTVTLYYDETDLMSALCIDDLATITSVHYYDKGNTENAITSSEYDVYGNRLIFKEIGSYDFRKYDCLKIAYSTPSNINNNTKLALLQIIAHWYEHREVVRGEGAQMNLEIPVGALQVLRGIERNWLF